jgi:hypothetical protein
MSEQLTESQLSILQKGKLRGKITIHTVELETYEFEGKVALEHKVSNGCVMRIDNKVYPIASPVESIFSFERRWDNTMIFLLALLFEMLILSVYLNINLWYTLEFKPDAGAYVVLILSCGTTFMAAYYAVKQQVLAIRLKEIPIAPDKMFVSVDDTGLEQRIRSIEVSEQGVLELLEAAADYQHENQRAELQQEIKDRQEELRNAPAIVATNITSKKNRAWRLKAATARSGKDVIFTSAFHIPSLPKANQHALDQLRKTQRIPSKESDITETLNLKILEFLKTPDANVKFLIQSLMYYSSLAFTLVEVITNKYSLIKATNQSLRDSINRYSVALSDQRLIAQDIDPQITAGSRKSARMREHLSEWWWIYAVSIACAIAIFIYVAATQGWFNA